MNRKGGMTMIRYVTAQQVEIDIHEMKREQAKKYLERFLSSANGNVREVTVIHGFSGGLSCATWCRRGSSTTASRPNSALLTPVLPFSS